MISLRLSLVLVLVSVLVSVAGACNSATDADQSLAQQIAQSLATDCPPASPDDEQARALCAAALSQDPVLASAMRSPFLHGAQAPGAAPDLDAATVTRLDALVWRRLYGSLMMFSPGVTIEPGQGGVTLVHMPVQLRNQLDTGSYPEPFWHSDDEWTSYQLARELIVVVRDGKWIGALRSADQDPARAVVAHTWSGQWTWQEGGQEMPYVARYDYLLSPDNPGASRLADAYQALADGLRQQSCMMCHSPDNYGASQKLDLLNYPNQALASRASLVADLAANSMPPANDLGLPVGIPDDGARLQLLDLAREFAAAGDAALAFEGEGAPPE